MTEHSYPTNWTVVRLGDFVANEKGKKPTSQSEKPSQVYCYPYVDIEAFEQGKIRSWTDGRNCRFCDVNDFLMVWDGSRSGLVGKGVSGALGSTLVRINFPGIYNPYAFYFLQSKYLEINNRARGTGTPHVDPALLWSYDFPVPPLAEQRRIVEKLEELFSELDFGAKSLQKAQTQLSAYRQSLLKDAFEGKLTEKWRAEHNEAIALSNLKADLIETSSKSVQAVLPNIPAEWCWVYLSNAGHLARGKSKHRPRNDPKLFGGVHPFIQTGEVKSAKKTIISYSNTYNEFGLSQSYLWPKGTLCITIAANIAETAFLGFDACFPDSIVGFIPIHDLVADEYIDLFIRSIRRRIEQYAPATAQKNINLKTLEELVIPLCSLAEQREIVRILEAQFSAIENAEQEIDQSLKRAEALRQSILKQAFSGKLAPQDPNDEPADILLERIRAERTASSGKRKKTASRN